MEPRLCRSKTFSASPSAFMLHRHPITSLDAPELAPYRSLKRPSEHDVNRIVVAQGVKIVTRLLESRFQMISLLSTEEWLAHLQPLWQAKTEEIHAYVAEKNVLETLAGFSMYQGVMAMARIPEPESIESVLQRTPRPWLLAAADQIHNAENMGVILRNCGAFGIHAFLQGETCCSAYMPRAVRTSMGAVLDIPVIQPPSLADLIRRLQQRGIRFIAAHAHDASKTLAQTDLSQDCCIVLGNEQNGITEPVIQACDETVAIPMQTGVDSLNVGSAGAVFFYEASRQRGKMGS
jgi:tRNA G18 (ribose-2'-O)-methylase SpoU